MKEKPNEANCMEKLYYCALTQPDRRPSIEEQTFPLRPVQHLMQHHNP